MVWIFIAFLILIGVVAYGNYLHEKRRREEMAVLAAELQWDFDPQKDTAHDDQYSHFEIFRKGHSRCALNTLTGRLEVEGEVFPVKMGDFRYKVTSGSGKNRSTRTYNLSYIIVHLPFLGIPTLLVRPEGMFDKLAGMIGFDDIDFESAEFSRRFYVGGNDKRFAYDVIHPRMMEFLLGSDPPTVDMEHGRVCVTDGRKRWSPHQFRQTLDWFRQFYALWPDFVKADLNRSPR